MESSLKFSSGYFQHFQHEKRERKPNKIGYENIQEPDVAAVPHGLMNK